MKEALRTATEAWVAQFNEVPGSVIEKMAKADEDMRKYAGPRGVRCDRCRAEFDGDLAGNCSLLCEKCGHENRWMQCDSCGYSLLFIYVEPSVFPCGPGPLFAPPSADRQWFLRNAKAVAGLGFFVFESEDYGVLLGLDAGGFDFYEAYWMPLYQLRGLRWHEQ